MYGLIRLHAFTRAAALLLLAGLASLPTVAHAGLYEWVVSDKNATPPQQALPREDIWSKPPLENGDQPKTYFDERIEPVAMVRTILSATSTDEITIPNPNGTVPPTVTIRSQDAAPAIAGTRQGFNLENAEFGARGRFNGPGIRYQLTLELNPRAKDGNPLTGDNLRDAWVAWDKYSVFTLRVGNMRNPFSQANNVGTGDQKLIYKPVLDNLVRANRVPGVAITLSDPWKILSATGGVYNAVRVPFQSLSFFSQVLWVWRADFRADNLLRNALAPSGTRIPFKFEWNLGINGTYTAEDFDIRGKERLFGFDTRLRIWMFSVEAEYAVRDWTQPTTADDPVLGVSRPAAASRRGNGYHVDFTIHAWEDIIDVTGRYEFFDGSQQDVNALGSLLDAEQVTFQKKEWITAGLRFTPQNNVRLYLNYIIRNELEGNRFDNNVIVGMVQLKI